MKSEELEELEMIAMYDGEICDINAIVFDRDYVDLYHNDGSIEYSVPIEQIEWIKFKNPKAIAFMVME